jgi:hypothetical protein
MIKDPFIVIGSEKSDGVPWSVQVVEFLVLAVVEEMAWETGCGVDSDVGYCAVKGDGIIQKLPH